MPRRVKLSLLVVFVSLVSSLVPLPSNAFVFVPSPIGTVGVCNPDPKTPKFWREYEIQALRIEGCARPYRFLKIPVKGAPKTKQLNESSRSPFCGVTPAPYFLSSRARGYHLSPNYKIHVAGITDSKHPSKSSPEKDYREYFRFLREGLDAITDVPSNYQITFSRGYRQAAVDFRTSGLGYKNANKKDQSRIAQAAIELYDDQIDFSSIDKLFVFVPPSVSRDVFVHSGTYTSDFLSDEGPVDGPYLGGRIDDFTHPGWISHEPLGFIHEMFHIGGGVAEDHYGAWPKGTPVSKQRGPAPGGTGNWGNMSGILTDWLAWDKYLARMIGEDQILCSTGEVEGNFWLRPSTHQTREAKLLLIKTGATTAVALESIRASGFNLKIPQRHHGVIVYKIDTSIQEHGLGVEIVRPPYRKGQGWPWGDRSVFDFDYADAALKLGEELRFPGFRIKVVESGTFGDVVRILPIN